MNGRRDIGYQLGLLSFIRPTTLLRMAHWLPTLTPRRLGRLLAVALGGWITAPLMGMEWIQRRYQIDAVELHDEPVFIIGHWRSGTTHLHNLMSIDPQFACLRMFEALAPDCSVSTKRWLPGVLGKVMPQKRPMDNMVWPMDAPQEEEIPLAKMTPYSWYLQFMFPCKAVQAFERYVLMNGAPRRARSEFKRKYLRLLKIAAIHDGGDRLLLKNPVNTARIPMLLELFPRARFVFIHRSPYEVFPSTVNLHRKILTLTALQDYTEDDIEHNVIAIYQQLLERYVADVAQVPTGQLVEIGYQDLVDAPEETLRHVYRSIGVDGFDFIAPRVREYLESISGYRTNSFEQLSDRRVELINRNWRIGFDRFGYDRRVTEPTIDLVALGARQP